MAWCVGSSLQAIRSARPRSSSKTTSTSCRIAAASLILVLRTGEEKWERPGVTDLLGATKSRLFGSDVTGNVLLHAAPDVRWARCRCGRSVCGCKTNAPTCGSWRLHPVWSCVCVNKVPNSPTTTNIQNCGRSSPTSNRTNRRLRSRCRTRPRISKDGIAERITDNRRPDRTPSGQAVFVRLPSLSGQKHADRMLASCSVPPLSLATKGHHARHRAARSDSGDERTPIAVGGIHGHPGLRGRVLDPGGHPRAVGRAISGSPRPSSARSPAAA